MLNIYLKPTAFFVPIHLRRNSLGPSHHKTHLCSSKLTLLHLTLSIPVQLCTNSLLSSLARPYISSN
jgi:hypothetical protein